MGMEKHRGMASPCPLLTKTSREEKVPNQLTPTKRKLLPSLRFFTRFNMPLFVVFALFGYWLIGIGKGYTSQNPHRLDENSEGTVLLVLDRDLRLHDAMSQEPEWIRSLLGDSSSETALEAAKETLCLLGEKSLLQQQGASALAVLNHLLNTEQQPEFVPDEMTAMVLADSALAPQQMASLESRLQQADAKWWEIALAQQIVKQQGTRMFDDEFQAQVCQNELLLLRAKFSGWMNWIIFFIGLYLMPAGVRRLMGSFRQQKWQRAKEYNRQWATGLLLSLIIATQLLGDEFIMTFYRMIDRADQKIWVGLGDFLWRMIPPALLLFIVYRKPRLMAKAFRLFQKPDFVLILSIYAALVVCDHVLYSLLGEIVAADPTMGLDRMEYGWAGLVFILLSACLFAPVAEEFVFRGFLFNTLLRRFGFLWSALATTVVFAVAHFYDVYGTISVGIFGFSTAVIYYATKSLSNAILLHVLYNLTITLPMWLVYQYPHG